MFRYALFTAALFATLLVGMPAPAHAAGPDRVLFDRTHTIAASPDTCPFPITSHLTGTFQYFTSPDGSSKITVADVKLTWSNPQSGASLTTPLAGPFMVSAPNADGLVVVTIDGNNARFVVPGQGVIFANTGRLVYLADPSDVNTPLEILQSSGIQDASPFPAVCSALA